ncbi:MAG: 4Fe-4S binding protein [Elusimicrobia bacterium]|nr:4Fe-4S binding protein [Candidatus Liberimonas magnetica]
MIRPGRMFLKVICSFFKKPATSMYPFIKIEKPAKFRGKLKFYQERCIGCKLCMKDCPSNAITIVNVGQPAAQNAAGAEPQKPAEKKFEAIVDLDKCLYCAQCVDSCMKKALEATREFELASLDHKKLKVKI